MGDADEVSKVTEALRDCGVTFEHLFVYAVLLQLFVNMIVKTFFPFHFCGLDV